MLVYKVDIAKCRMFLGLHPSVRLSMERYGSFSGTLMQRYRKWLDWLKENEANISDYSETVDSPSFGKKTFYKFNWNGVSGWAELFQYVNAN